MNDSQGIRQKNALLSGRAEHLRKHYYSVLFDDIIPWWSNYSIDREYGGYFTRLERDGKPYAYDKDMWMTAREIWMFSHLYNKYKKDPTWYENAQHGLDFMLKYAFMENGKMYFRLNRQGKELSHSLSLYTEVFASIAVAEFSYIDKNEKFKKRAIEMYDRLIPRLGQPADTPLLGYPIKAEFHLHAHDMCRMTVAWVYDDLWPGQRFADDITLSYESILSKHWKPDRRALLENVAMDGSPLLDLPEGRMFHPGHAIESAWMIMEVALKRNDQELMVTAIDILLASLEHGWDKEYGGIRYITNFDWTPCHNLEADLKLWWPHGEALYALLLAWARTGREDLGQWYEKVHDYTFKYFPDPEYGEWFGYLNRDGSRVWSAKANGWKGFFHLPRVLFRCYQVLEQE
jgi:N-acylglucosamine 2-epimerase